jgi:hypothetical protein
MSTNEHQTISYHLTDSGWYVLDAPLVYVSPRYRKTVTVPAGFRSDGASGPAVDVASLSWWVHDILCTSRQWDDGSPCPPWQRSTVLHDILNSEGRWFRARTWWAATLAWESWRDMWR